MAKGRILIVDDEVNARAALAEILKDDGYAVETAADGFEALGKLADFAPDIVVTDLRMPGMNGLDLMRRLRAEDPELVLIVMTTFGSLDTAVAAMKAGAADYVTKPLDTIKLGLVLAREMERRQHAPEGPAAVATDAARKDS